MRKRRRAILILLLLLLVSLSRGWAVRRTQATVAVLPLPVIAPGMEMDSLLLPPWMPADELWMDFGDLFSARWQPPPDQQHEWLITWRRAPVEQQFHRQRIAWLLTERWRERVIVMYEGRPAVGWSRIDVPTFDYQPAYHQPQVASLLFSPRYRPSPAPFDQADVPDVVAHNDDPPVAVGTASPRPIPEPSTVGTFITLLCLTTMRFRTMQ